MDTNKVLELISKGDLDQKLLDIYIDARQLTYQRERYMNAIKKFIELYGDGEIQMFSAPGRSIASLYLTKWRKSFASRIYSNLRG